MTNPTDGGGRGPAIPLVDLVVQHRRVAAEVEAGLQRLFATAAFVLGEDVVRFEQAFARYCGVAHCRGVANGTDAIELALRGLGVGAGDEVIVPANTFVATAEAVVRAGATVVLVDCAPDHHLIDPVATAESIGPRTKVLLPVHLYGDLAPMEAIAQLAEAHGLRVVEDAAQAQGASDGTGRRAGSFGAAAATSFYPGKNLGAYGDGGAVMTPSAEVAERVGMLRNHGQAATYDHVEIGWNSRLDSIQAVVLTAKLAHLDAWNDERRQAAARYGELLGGLADVELPTPSGPGSVWHLYVVQVPDRDRLLAYLRGRGIGAAVHYPVPIHLMPAWAGLGWHRGDFPNAERRAGRILSLPLFPGITPAQQERVVDELARGMASS